MPNVELLSLECLQEIIRVIGMDELLKAREQAIISNSDIIVDADLRRTGYLLGGRVKISVWFEGDTRSGAV